MRTAILHVDDLGSSHGANRAFLDLAARGLVTSGSIMAPCPWFREIAEAGAANPALDFGVHLTLTSEWRHYRWAPLSTTSRASGLIDEDGYFPRDVATLRRGLVPQAAEAELREQIERCRVAGLSPTHLDAHMGAAMLASLLPVQLRLAREYGMFPVLPRSITWAPDPGPYREALAELDAAGLPVIDHCRGTLPAPSGELPARWQAMIDALPRGLTHFALHATEPGDFAAIAPEHAPWRFAERDLLASGAIARMLAHAGVAAAGYRTLAQAFQSGEAAAMSAG